MLIWANQLSFEYMPSRHSSACAEKGLVTFKHITDPQLYSM